MDQLPLYDEIRQTRARSVEANAAAADLRALEGISLSVSLLLAQANKHPALDSDVPGDDLVASLAERWPALADLDSNGPRGSQTYAQRLLARETQLDIARRALAPIGGQADHLRHELQHLVNDQARAMERAGLTDAIAELAAINEQRVEVSQELLSVTTRTSRLHPAFAMLDTFVEKLVVQTEKASSGSRLEATLALQLAASLVGTIRTAFSELELEASMPKAPEVPDEIDVAEAVRASNQVRDELLELRAIVTDLYEGLTTREQALRQKGNALYQSVVERTG